MLADMATQIAAARMLIYKAAVCSEDGFPDVTEAAQAKIFASEMAIKVTNDALQIFGAAGYSRNRPLERMVRDARMFTIGGGTAQILRTVVASRLLDRKLPQSRSHATVTATCPCQNKPRGRYRTPGHRCGIDPDGDNELTGRSGGTARIWRRVARGDMVATQTS
jgi:hypothetical protein